MQQHIFSHLPLALGARPVSKPDLLASPRYHLHARERRRLAVSVAASNGDGKDASKKSPLAGRSFGENLEERIASGEFDDSGSTKEKITRPVRKLLAKDPLGPGE